MISISINAAGSLEVGQIDAKPTVSLDHWALREIAHSVEQRQRFASALRRTKGTLMITWIDLIEFTKLSDTRHARDADLLVELIMPQLAFLEPTPRVVIRNENRVLRAGRGVAPIAPHFDLGLLKWFVLRSTRSLRLIDGSGLFATFSSSRLADRLRSRWAKTTSVMSAGVLEGRRRLGRGKARPDRVTGAVVPATRFVEDQLVNYLLNSCVPLNERNWSDYFHTVVPLSYCDIVLLDKHWAERGRGIERWLKRSSFKGPAIAKVFSKSNMAAFWRELDGDGPSA